MSEEEEGLRRQKRNVEGPGKEEKTGDGTQRSRRWRERGERADGDG